jgi:hypothetical protein
VHHQTVRRCVERATASSAIAALDDLPRPGREPTIAAEAKTWLVNLACARPRSLAIRMSCGRRGSSPGMLANADRRKAIPA